jgi:iron complex transport system ATP-binding protein
MLLAENLSIGYKNNQSIFSGINFLTQKGDVTALLGVNGIGKSTLLRTIAGLQKKLDGQLDFDGRNLNTIPVTERAKLISVVLTERLQIEHILVRDFIALGRSPYTGRMGNLSAADNEIVKRVIFAMKIEKLKERIFNQLSDGEKQKVLIARAVCQETPVMILDEPSAFLDFRNRKEIFELLQRIGAELGKVVIFSTHDIEAALNYCNKFWIMTEEKMFCEIRKGESYREEVLGMLYGKKQGGNGM